MSRPSKIVAFVVCLTLAPAFAARTWRLGGRVVPGPLPPRTDAAAPALDTRLDIVYGEADGQLLKLDFAKPTVCRGQSVPVIVYIHGGGWRSGTKSGAFDLNVVKMGFQLGFGVASIDYRLAPKFRFPVQINDCKLAVRFLRANAADFGIDPARIGAAGGSAGGHLASLLALTDERDGLEGPGLEGVSSRILAAVDEFGPADLTDAASLTSSEGMSMLVDFLGCDPFVCRDRAWAASPVAYVGADDPPILIIHGDKDTLVPFRQSEIFAERLRIAGNPCALIKVHNAEHGLIPSPITATVTPSFDAIDHLALAHLARYLEPAVYGDLNLDGRRDMRDFQAMGACLGLFGVGPGGVPASASWNPLADLVPDGLINGADLLEFLRKK
jgi:acetyl esterase/lipase